MLLAGVIADDLTGALEMGAIVADSGLRTVVTIGCRAPPQAVEALVIDTESRNELPDRAARSVSAAARALLELGITQVFKKVDSTLRGPIASELQALHEVWPTRSIVLAPAYPRLGRTVCQGRLLVGGVPVSNTDFASDPTWPVSDSLVRAVAPPASDSWLRIPDASTDQDLRDVLLCHDGSDHIFTGSGGLGRAWAAQFATGKPPRQATGPLPSKALLVVSGSHHPASAALAEEARRRGHRVLCVPAAPGNPERILRQLIHSAVQEIERNRPELLVIFGGDTAASLLSATGTAEIFSVGELLPGIALARANILGRDTLLLTKAGGFDVPRLLHTILGGTSE